MSGCSSEILLKKVKSEYEAFIKELSQKPPQQIIELSYEKVYKEELVSVLETSSFTETDAALLCELDHPLDDLYQELLYNEYSCVGFLEYTIRQFIKGHLTGEDAYGKK